MSIKVITGKVRASFVHVFEPQSINGSEPKIIPSTKRMVYQPTGSIYQVLSSEVATKHGLNVSACFRA